MSREAVVIFLFSLEALLTRVSRAQSSAIPLFPTTTRLLLAPRAIELVSNFFLFLCGPWDTTVLFKYRLPYSLAQSFYIKSLTVYPASLKLILVYFVGPMGEKKEILQRIESFNGKMGRNPPKIA
jgi:hypothetical protein